MVVYRKGADPDVLDRVATRFDGFAGECSATRSAVDGALGSLGSCWGGRDYEAFHGEWRSSVPSIDALERALSGLGGTLRDNAARQRVASGQTGGNSSGIGPAGVEPAGFQPATTGGGGAGGAVDGFDFGEPKKPDITWDEGFEYGSKDAGWRDHLRKMEWMAKLQAGRIAKSDLDDATAMYAHYWDNNGEPIRFDYEEGYREDASIRTNVDSEVTRTAAAVDEMVRGGNTTFSVTGDAHPSAAYPSSENWQKTVGGYQQWSSADVSVENGVVTMKVTVHAEDYYNFNPDQADIASGAGDNENGRFTEIGWAKPFPSSGDVTRSVTWPVGDPPPDVTGGGDESRNPGREDRVDERDNPRSGRPDNDRDTGKARVP